MADGTRRKIGVGLTLLAVVAALWVSVVARGATSQAASTYGTFAHIATSDLSTSAAKQAVAQNYDTIALRGSLTAPLLADLHARRAGIVLLAYEKAAGLNATEVTDFRINHPDWIAHDALGGEIHPKTDADTTLADLTNAAFRDWSADKFAAEVAQGADGTFVDTLGAYFPPDFYTARPIVNGLTVTDAAWRDGSVDLVQKIKTKTARPVIANGFGLGSGAAYFAVAADADLLIAAADGVQIENFTRAPDASPGQYRTADKWDQDVAFLELLGARGKTVLAYTKVHATATPGELVTVRDYALGSFLTAFFAGRSSFGFDDGNRIPAVPSDASWARGLGGPMGTRARAGSDAWSRRFQNGLLTLKVATAPVVSGRQIATFTGSGSARSEYSLTVAAGSVNATVTWSGGGYKTLLIRQGATYLSGTPKTGTNPLGFSTTLPAGTYTFGVQGGSSAPFALQVDYPAAAPDATTTTTGAGTSTTTTVPATTTTRAPTTTTSTTAAARRSTTFSGSGATRTEWTLAVGAGPVTATVTWSGGGYKTLLIRQAGAYLGGTPKSGASPLVVTTTLAAGTYTFGVQGGSSAAYTLTIDYPAA
jgi:hypothetical protein